MSDKDKTTKKADEKIEIKPLFPEQKPVVLDA